MCQSESGPQSRTLAQIGSFIENAQHFADGVLQRRSGSMQLSSSHPDDVAEEIAVLDPANR
jgi:hypothetical protein